MELIVDPKADTFKRHRARLFGIAYRMLSSKADAEDVLQDAYLRWHESDGSAVCSSEAWLTTAVTRLSIDRLRRRRTEREAYAGPWLPEPLSERELRTPEDVAELDGDFSIAFLTMLETLSPEERAAFVLHDVLDDDYADIAESLGKSEPACRQMVHRARERLRRGGDDSWSTTPRGRGCSRSSSRRRTAAIATRSSHFLHRTS
jgi:RNA polymerase sigma-70 factor (ECF subfamily)